jgi:hypothetical protein
MLGASLIGLAVTFCASPTDVPRRDEATCISRGFAPGTADLAACVRQEQERAERRCNEGPLAALHIKPHPDPLSCRDDPA